MGDTIRTCFSKRRPIERTIEKVIDFYAQENERLEREIAEYEVTENIERCFEKFLDVFGEGVRAGNVTQIGIWVSGFYGSGKSSFTKYLGAALEGKRIGDRSFNDLLCERFRGNQIPGLLRTISEKHKTAVVMLDLGAEQLADSAAAPVTSVLYWKVLQWAGYSKEKKTAQLEFTLDKRDKYDDFKQLYRDEYGSEWVEIHNDPLIGVARAAKIVPRVLPNEFPTPESYRTLRFEEAKDIRDLAREIILLSKRKTDRKNVLFLIDEAGQYVAPRGELILNLDGFARNLKELGAGKVWIVATGQQTLSEIVEKAAHNSAELNKLRDRFPISIHLDASDIRDALVRTSHRYRSPFLSQKVPTSLSEGSRANQDELGSITDDLEAARTEIDAGVCRAYGIDRPSSTDKRIPWKPKASSGTLKGLAGHVIDYVLGVIFGRWEVRLLLGNKPGKGAMGPFVPIPICSPGMLTGEHGQPLPPTEIPSDYPVWIATQGVASAENTEFANQSGEDAVARIRETLAALWGQSDSAIEDQICEALSAQSISEYLLSPAKYFKDHVQHHTKSKRKAPLYLPLSSETGAFTAWVYYQRLTDQTIYLVLNRLVEPRIGKLQRLLVREEILLGSSSGTEGQNWSFEIVFGRNERLSTGTTTNRLPSLQTKSQRRGYYKRSPVPQAFPPEFVGRGYRSCMEETRTGRLRLVPHGIQHLARPGEREVQKGPVNRHCTRTGASVRSRCSGAKEEAYKNEKEHIDKE